MRENLVILVSLFSVGLKQSILIAQAFIVFRSELASETVQQKYATQKTTTAKLRYSYWISKRYCPNQDYCNNSIIVTVTAEYFVSLS